MPPGSEEALSPEECGRASSDLTQGYLSHSIRTGPTVVLMDRLWRGMTGKA